MALVFKHPFTAIVAGPSSSGKTSFVLKLLQHVNDVISPAPTSILWCYGTYQRLFDGLSAEVEFHEGLPDVNTLRENSLLIIDDLMTESNETVNKIFTKYSHHKSISVIFLTQNLFHKGARTMTLNAHYLILFKNPRDASQISHLARQMFPGHSKYMIEAFADATQMPYSYLVIDLTASTEDQYRLRSGIFPDEENFVYVPK